MCALYLHHATQILSVCVRGTKDMNSVKSDEINASVMSKNYSFNLIKIYCVCISLLYRTQLQLCWIANKSYCILLKAIFFMRMPFSHCSVVLEVERELLDILNTSICISIVVRIVTHEISTQITCSFITILSCSAISKEAKATYVY